MYGLFYLFKLTNYFSSSSGKCSFSCLYKNVYNNYRNMQVKFKFDKKNYTHFSKDIYNNESFNN